MIIIEKSGEVFFPAFFFGVGGFEYYKNDLAVKKLAPIFELHAILLKPLKFISNLFKRNVSTVDTLQISEEEKKEVWENKVADLGAFSYNSSGFDIDLKNEFHSIRWADIERLVAYKADLMTTDEICIDIIFDNKTIIVTEEIRGWYQFIDRLKYLLSNVNNNWEAQVLKSPFEYDLTTIYERTDRKMPLKSNFTSIIKGKTKEELNYIFEKKGWTVRKPSLRSYKYENSWTEVVLESDKENLIINGLVAYHSDNVEIIKRLYEDLKCSYKWEFYDENKHIIASNQHGM